MCVLCAGLTCAAHAAAVHLLLSVSDKSRQKRILLVKTVSFYQRKVGFVLNALRRQFESFILSPSYSKRFAAIEFFSFTVGLSLQASTNSRRQFSGFVLLPSQCKRFTTFHIFPLPTCAAVARQFAVAL